VGRKRFGSDLIVDVIKQYEFEYVTLNPGSSFRGLHDSLVNYGGNVRPAIIECPHENTAIGMAHGYAKVTGKPLLAILHDLVGLLHACLAIYYAYQDRVPMVVAGATGPMDLTRRRPHIDWIHTALVQGNAVRDYVKWDDQPYGVRAVPDSFARAYRVANTEPKGPTYICFDVDLQEDPFEEEVRLPDVGKLLPPTPIQADARAIDTAARLLVGAKNPVIVADYLGRNRESVRELVDLSELLSVPVIDLMSRFNFPAVHPLDLTGSDCLHSADLLLALDVRDLTKATTERDIHTKHVRSVLSGDCKVVEMGLSDLGISSWSAQYGKLSEVDLSVLCDTSIALPELTRKCRELLSEAGGERDGMTRRFEALRKKHESTKAAWQEEAHRNWDARPMTPARLAFELGEAISGEDWVLTANTLYGWARRLWQWDEPYRHAGESLGTATQLNISLGVALAYKGTGKLVVDIQPDGDLMFDASALWVASHYRIPLLVVMLNNRAYRNSWYHQAALARKRGNPIERANIGTELTGPAPDFAALARSFGWYAEGPIEDGSKVADAVKRALQVLKNEGRPALVDTVTALD